MIFLCVLHDHYSTVYPKYSTFFNKLKLNDYFEKKEENKLFSNFIKIISRKIERNTDYTSLIFTKQ